MYTHMDKKFSCGRCNKRFTCFRVTLTYTETYTSTPNHMNVWHKGLLAEIQMATGSNASHKDAFGGQDQMCTLQL